MQAVFTRPNDMRPNLSDRLRIKTRSLGVGRGTRVYVDLLIGLESFSKGRRDFESLVDVHHWVDQMREELVALRWTERRR